MTVKRAIGLGIVMLLGARAAAAQASWAPPRCELKPKHYLVNSGLLYLKHSTESKFEDVRQRDMKDAYRVLTQALTSGDQAENPAAWYYLARYYVLLKDLGGADSAFDQAAALAPACKDDINFWRRQLWVPLLNSGIQAWQVGNTDSAITAFRRANAIYDAEPMGLRYLATLYANANLADSAARYFRLAIAAAGDAKFAKDKQEAMFNLARVYHRAARWGDAAATYREYLMLAPNDPEATASLASVYATTGKRDSATILYTGIVDRADSATPLQLFQAGVEIFRAGPAEPDTAAVGERCRSAGRRDRRLTPRQIAVRCNAETADTMRAYQPVAAAQYRLAAHAFEAGLARNPYYRDALFDLANTYLVLKDSALMLPVAQRVYAQDPWNRGTLRLLAAAFLLRGRGDSTLRYLVMADSLLPVDVTVSTFTPEDSSGAVSGLVTNFHAKPSAPFKLTFEFLSAAGDVVAAQTIDVPAIEPDGSFSLRLRVSGKGIVAWRYKTGIP